MALDLLAAALLVGFPALSAWSQRGGRMLNHARRDLYLSSMAALWLMVGLSAAVLWLSEGGVKRLGLGPLPAPDWIPAGAALVACGMAVVSAEDWLRRRRGWPESAALLHLMPRTRGEWLLWCLAVAPTAGFCEEVLFRGFALSYLLERSGSAPLAVVLVSAGFAAGHAYQGRLAVLHVFALGVLFALPVLWTGSVWIAVLAHALIDILAPWSWQRQIRNGE